MKSLFIIIHMDRQSKLMDGPRKNLVMANTITYVYFPLEPLNDNHIEITLSYDIYHFLIKRTHIVHYRVL